MGLLKGEEFCVHLTAEDRSVNCTSENGKTDHLDCGTASSSKHEQNCVLEETTNMPSPLYLGSLEDAEKLKTGHPRNLTRSNYHTGAITETFKFLQLCEHISQFNPIG